MNYYVAKNLKHDNRAYVRGEQVELPEQVAAPLLEDGVIQTEPVVDPVSPANLDRVQRSPAKPGREPKKGQEQPKVGGERTETGEPSIDGQPETQTPAQDVTPQTDNEPEAGNEPVVEPSVDGQPEAPTPESDITPGTLSSGTGDVDPSANL